MGCKQRFYNLCGLKSTNLKALKMDLPFGYKKKFRVKNLNTRFFKNILQEDESHHYYHYLYPCVFMFGISNFGVSSAIMLSRRYLP